MKPSMFFDGAAMLGHFNKQLPTEITHAKVRKLLVPYTVKSAAMFDQPTLEGMPLASKALMDSLGIIDRYLNMSRTEGLVKVTNF